MTYSGKKILIILFFTSLLLSLFVNCATPFVKQFYPDVYHDEEGIYENRPLRFMLKYSANWVLFTNPNEMDNATKKLAETFAMSGAELLFVGTTTEALHGTRGIAYNFNESAMAYAERIREANKSDITNDKGIEAIKSGSQSFARWIYNKAEFRFAEYFFTIDTYNIRIAFWCRQDMFERFLPEYDAIMSTLEPISGQ